ncbi:MAG TPA: DUF177 domain-containing protein [Capsulimonadaceae bacterium]
MWTVIGKVAEDHWGTGYSLMLRLDLSEIVRTIGMQQVYEISDPPYAEDDVEFVSPVVGRIAVTNSGKLLLARGHFDTTIEMECARCLADVRQPLHAEIEEQYSLSEVNAPGFNDHVPAIVPDEENEIPEGLFEGTLMNVNVLIRQAAILSAPLSVLCREDCAGLCPSCGNNKNSGTCSCAPDGTNRPFAALPELFRQEPTD